ncbi:MAG: hypothetical protein WBG71_13720 [Leeuwenhoekiella sp.]
MSITPIAFIRVLLDFGLVVLIWLVQLVIYPGLCRYAITELKIWHKAYMKQVSYVVMPLMVGQLGVVVYQLIQVRDVYTVGSLAIILLLWASTFFRFVPLHQNIETSANCEELTRKLVYRNWSRTLLWTLLFMWSVFEIWS